MSKAKGFEIADLTIGARAEATKEKHVVANVRMFLRTQQLNKPFTAHCGLDCAVF
jgi:hypothetical protein